MTLLKQSFNQNVYAYEEFRPTYPGQMFKDILSYSNLQPQNRLLEIGTGTGKATEGFINLGYERITGIEYGENLAAFTNQKFKDFSDLHIHHSSFEDWENGENHSYQLAYSGTTFHFIPADAGYPKVASLLDKNGVIAFFWFVHVSSDEPVFQAIRKIYQKYAPHLDDQKAPLLEEVIKERSELTLKSGHFHNLKVHTYEWNQHYTPEEYIGLLNTHSGHQVLEEEQKNTLYQKITLAINHYGGCIHKTHVVALFLARKK